MKTLWILILTSVISGMSIGKVIEQQREINRLKTTITRMTELYGDCIIQKPFTEKELNYFGVDKQK